MPIHPLTQRISLAPSHLVSTCYRVPRIFLLTNPPLPPLESPATPDAGSRVSGARRRYQRRCRTARRQHLRPTATRPGLAPWRGRPGRDASITACRGRYRGRYGSVWVGIPRYPPYENARTNPYRPPLFSLPLLTIELPSLTRAHSKNPATDSPRRRYPVQPTSPLTSGAPLRQLSVPSEEAPSVHPAGRVRHPVARDRSHGGGAPLIRVEAPRPSLTAGRVAAPRVEPPEEG